MRKKLLKATAAIILALMLVFSIVTPVEARASPANNTQADEDKFRGAQISVIMINALIRDTKRNDVVYFFFDPDRSFAEVGDDGNVYVLLSGTQKYLTKTLGEPETRELLAGTWHFMHALHATIALDSELYVALMYDEKLTYITDGKTVFDDRMNFYPFVLPKGFRDLY